MSKSLVSPNLDHLILTIRNHRVILDTDLAKLYGVPTKRLNEQVKRNTNRFPEEFMFTLTQEEAEELLRSRSQIATASSQSIRSQIATASKRNVRYRPHVFTEHGALMAANVLNSPQAVTVSVTVVKAFIKLRRLALSIEEVARKVESLERGFKQHGQQFETVFKAIRQLMTPPPEPPRKKMGFHAD